MTTDLVSRLRAWNGNSFGPYKSPVPDLLEAANEIERLRAGLQLIATDEHRLMNVTARLIAESILSGKPI